MEQRLFTPWTAGISVGVHLLAMALLALGPLGRPRPTFSPGRTITIRVAPPLPRVKPAPPHAVPTPPAAAPAKKLPPPKPPAKSAPKPAMAPAQTSPTSDSSSSASASDNRSGLAGTAAPGASVAGIDAVYFPFDYYIAQMLNRFSSNWYRPPTPPGTACVIRFVVAKSGRILQAEVERSSGEAAFDRAALRAVLSSNPLPPLPFEYNDEKLGIHLKFE